MEKTAKNPGGRPRKPPKDLRDRKLEIRLSAREESALNQAVEKDVSTWAREVLLRAAKRKG